MTEDAKPGNTTRIVQPETEAQAQFPYETPEPDYQLLPMQDTAVSPSQPMAPPEIPATPIIVPAVEQYSPVLQSPVMKVTNESAEDLLSQMAGSSARDEVLKQVAEAVLARQPRRCLSRASMSPIRVLF